MTDEKKGIWNGGKTNITTKEATIFRQMEDSYDLDDSEIEFREELQEREKLMKREAKHQKIESKYTLSKKPLHELYTNIDYSEKTKITGIGGIGGPIDAIRSKTKVSSKPKVSK
jgi:hypothetical protein